MVYIDVCLRNDVRCQNAGGRTFDGHSVDIVEATIKISCASSEGRGDRSVDEQYAI